jgi:hypothetical protein
VICGSHGSDSEECHLLAFDAVLSGRRLVTFQRNALFLASGLKIT